MSATLDSNTFFFERSTAGDFPLYQAEASSLISQSNPEPDDTEHDLTATNLPVNWWILWVSTLVGFACLSLSFPIFNSSLDSFLPAILFVAIPLFSMLVFGGHQWRALFRKPQLSDIAIVIVVALSNLFVTTLIALLLMTFAEANVNPAVKQLASLSNSDQLTFLICTIIQLFGEELVSIIPFLGVLSFCHHRLHMSRKHAIVIATFVTALLFSAMHLPTYDWNLVQCFLVIGTARIILLLAYIITKNLWVATATHILNDWLIFAVAMA